MNGALHLQKRRTGPSVSQQVMKKDAIAFLTQLVNTRARLGMKLKVSASGWTASGRWPMKHGMMLTGTLWPSSTPEDLPKSCWPLMPMKLHSR